ncbi:MAG: cytochrome C biogenesis protein [Betaproteobacteria bacterium HGW-Betaproteobacteria-20]|jgi:cytochrome c-type biogenesis protein CcmH|nr:MAG: cytochrome C biogenesis protein [Betaproteobacteria bacterium HGW-Betaproteobacteria-20]
MKSLLFFRIILALFLMQSVMVFAQEAQSLQSNAAVEAQVQRLSKELRCLVCQNQTIADSHAGLAEDLKLEIREMATKGMTDQAIVDYLVARYGDFVRYRPPLKLSTVLLWLGPFALLLAGGIGLFLMLRRRQKIMVDTPLSADEARKVRELLNKES